MPEIHPIWTEELSVDIAGGEADRHAIKATVLAESLIGLEQLAQKVNSNVFGRDIKL